MSLFQSSNLLTMKISPFFFPAGTEISRDSWLPLPESPRSPLAIQPPRPAVLRDLVAFRVINVFRRPTFLQRCTGLLRQPGLSG
ncbi:MAG: hypothetical protein B9S34_01040 [Opitutia bacterium Tous-C1TDCM]|nr:MAG: hypothetical protein B9S34_01040 [Opitutae bacterium Tous-C1TDCM]